MSDAIEFYISLTKMSEKELLEFEDAINNDLKINTEQFIKYLNTKKFDGRIEGILETDQSNFFLDLLTIRMYLFEQNIEYPEREISKYMIDVQKAKDKREF